MAKTLRHSKHKLFLIFFFLVIFVGLHLAFCVTHVGQKLQMQKSSHEMKKLEREAFIKIGRKPGK